MGPADVVVTAFDLVVLGIRGERREATGVGRRSGSAVLNLRTGGICGVMKRARDPESSEGIAIGGAAVGEASIGT